jgi:hypothetical protein
VVAGVLSLDASGQINAGNLVVDTANVVLSTTSAQSIAHTGAGGADFSLSFTNGNVANLSGGAHVAIGSVTIAAPVVTGVSSMNVSGTAAVGSIVADTGDVDLVIGDLTMSSTSAQAITHIGAGGADFSISSTNGNAAISSGGDVLIESVTFLTGVVTGVSSLEVSGATTSGSVTVDTGALTIDIGSIVLGSSTAAQSIAHTGAGGADFAISSTNGNVVISSGGTHVSIESMTVASGVVPDVSSIDVIGAATVVGNLLADTGNVNVTNGNVDSSTW